MAEILQGTMWQTVAYSSPSPTSGFVEVANSPILTNDEACPMIFLNSNSSHAYLYSTDNTAWLENTREVNLGSSTMVQPTSLSNYQIRLTVNFGSGNSAVNTVYLNNHSQSDFSDVRFTWFNGSINSEVGCPYWIEQITPGVNATFWVKIPQIPAAGTSTMYIYYGKSNVATTSNGTATFEFFDDFSGNLSKWDAPVGGNWQIQNGQLVAQTTGFGQYLRASNFVFGNASVHSNIEWTSGTCFESGPCVRGQAPNEQSNGYVTFLSTSGGDNKNRISLISSGAKTTIAGQGITNPSQNVWYSCVLNLYGNFIKGQFSPLYPVEINASDTTFSTGSLSLFAWASDNETVHYDNVFVTKYVYPEPIQASWYNEEIGTIVAIDNSSVSCGRASIGSAQTVAFHAQWLNGSSITSGSIYINGSQCSINSTGWACLAVSSSIVARSTWAVSAVNCNGITAIIQTIVNPSIIWDQITITAGGIIKYSDTLGDNATVWFTANYQYDSMCFDNSKGSIYVNGSQMLWVSANNRWESYFPINAVGTSAFKISKVIDTQYNLTSASDCVGALNLIFLDQPLIMVSNSTVSGISFNSTGNTLNFNVAGPSGTMGFVNLSVFKTLITDIANLKVCIDGNSVSFVPADNGGYYSIQFTYTQSIHNVTVVLSSSTPSPSPSALPSTAPSPTPYILPTTQPSSTLQTESPTTIPTPTSSPNTAPSSANLPTTSTIPAKTQGTPLYILAIVVAAILATTAILSISVLWLNNHRITKKLS